MRPNSRQDAGRLGGPPRRDARTNGTPEKTGKHILYSQTERKPRTCTVECSSCYEETRVNYLELAALMFPVHFHVPVLRYHHSWFRCPACGKRTWLRIHLDR